MRVKILVAAAAFALPLAAGEYVVLDTGFRLRVERHETDGPRTKLFYANGGHTILPTEQIAGFEPEEAPPAAAPEPKPATPDATVSPLLVESVIAAESAWNPRAISPKGAMGLMQLMPATARELGVANSLDPAQNVRGGTAYLRQLLDRYAGQPNRLERALAAYNAGPARADKYGGVPPYRETVDFVSRVAQRLLAFQQRP